MKIQEFRELIGAVSQWSASVKSAANVDERAREVETLKSAVAELRAAAAGKKVNFVDLQRATSVLREADRLIGYGSNLERGA